MYLMMKRLFDIVAAYVGIVLLTPLFLLIMLWIKLDSPGKVFFRQQRVGRYATPFSIYKFRTMLQDAESLGKQITVGRDQRITRSGHFLRKYKLDELPQLFNVLLGDMSFVGPRPEVPVYVNLYTYSQRAVLSVRPGITDEASIQFSDENALLAEAMDPEKVYIEEIMQEKLRINLDYMQRASLKKDVEIIMKTVAKILFRRGKQTAFAELKKPKDSLHILLINHYAGSIRHGMEYRPYYMASQWVQQGHRVTIAAASFSHLRSKAQDGIGKLVEEEIDGIRYVWLKTPAYQGNGIGRVLNMLVFVWRLFIHQHAIIKDRKVDIVIASSTYPLDIYPARAIAKKCKAKLIYEVHDLWPLSPIELGGMSPKHPFIMLMQAAENFAYRKANHVVSMLPKAESHMREHGMIASKFVYIPNGIDVNGWGASEPIPELHDRLLRKKRLKGEFLVGYTGAHGLANALDTFIEAAHLLREQPITFVLVGQGPEQNRLREKAVALGLENVVLLPAIQKNSIPALLSEMDAFYIGLKSESLFRFGISPNKMMDYMMAGKPIINAIAAGNDPVAESGCGISVIPESPTATAEAILQLFKLGTREREAMGMKGREYVLKYHDYAQLAWRFIEVMQEPRLDSASNSPLSKMKEANV